jgi:chromosome segregation ATPase
MHNELVKLNDKISKSAKLQQILLDSNSDKENEIWDRLKKREAEARELEKKINEFKGEKRQMLDELIDVERQIMYWEKKIEIQKEIQDTLDPEIGQEEITKMKKEIHLMEQRVDEMKRMAQKKIQEMEKTIVKKEIIMIKGKSQEHQSKKKTNTKAAIYKEDLQMTQEIEKRKVAAQKTYQQIRKLQQEAEEAVNQIQQIEQELSSENREMDMLREQIDVMNVEKNRLIVEKNRIKDLSRLYHDVLNNNYQSKYSAKTMEKKHQDLEKQRQKIVEIVKALQNEYETAREQFNVVSSILSH